MGKIRKSTILILIITGLLLIGVIWLQAQNQERGIVAEAIPFFDTGEINKITLTQGNKALEMYLDAQSWKIKDQDHAADEVKIDRLLHALHEVKLGAIAAEAADRHEVYEISDQNGLLVSLYSNDEPKFQLYFGKRGRDGTSFIRLPGSNRVFRAIKSPLHELQLDEFSWRNKQLFKLAPEQIDSIKVFIDGTSYTILQDGSSLSVVSDQIDQNFRIDENRVRSFIRNLVMLKAVNFDDSPIGQIRSALAVFEITAGNDVYHMVIGQLDDDNNHSVQVEDCYEIYKIPASVVEQIAKPVQLLRSLRMFNAKQNEVTAVRLGDQEHIELVRDSQGNFQLGEGLEDSEFDSYTANSVVRSVVTLWASKYYGPGSRDDIGPISRTIEIQDQNGWHKIELGQKDENGFYKAVGDYPGLYGIDEYNIRKISSGLKMFHKAPNATDGQGGYEQFQKLPPHIQNQIMQKVNQQLQQ